MSALRFVAVSVHHQPCLREPPIHIYPHRRLTCSSPSELFAFNALFLWEHSLCAPGGAERQWAARGENSGNGRTYTGRARPASLTGAIQIKKKNFSNVVATSHSSCFFLYLFSSANIWPVRFVLHLQNWWCVGKCETSFPVNKLWLVNRYACKF